jgi:hypothetical protein
MVGVLLIASLNALAQDLSRVHGKLIDTNTRDGMVGATVQLISVRDTSQHFITASDKDGFYLFNKIPATFYKLIYSSIGYKPEQKFVRVKGVDTDLGVFESQPDTTVLDDVEVNARAIMVEIKGDTTAINAQAYKTNPDATAEDLIAKMPGIVVNGTGVQAQGEQVGKVLVDGREFFANDPSIALKSIPAEIVQKIEIFDQQSDQAQFSGFDDGNTTKTLNIVTKPENRNGQFGRAYIGANANSQFKAGGNINHFDKALRLSVVGLSNNINLQNFTSEDLLGIASAGSRRGGRGGGAGGGTGGFSGGGENFQPGQQGGISETHAYGINYSDEWGEKIKITGSYFFNFLDNQNDQLVNRENFVPDMENQFYNEVNNSNRINYNHRFNGRLIYAINERNSIIFTPRVSWQKTNLDDLLAGKTRVVEGTVLNSLVNNYYSINSGYNASGNLLLRHRFEKRGRTLSLGLSLQANDNNGDTQLDNITVFDEALTDVDSIQQQVDLFATGVTYGASVNYTEPLGERSQMQIGYRLSLNQTDSDKRTFDASGEADLDMPLDTMLSNVFNSQYTTHSPSIGIMYRKDKLFLRAGLAYQSASLDNAQKFPQENKIGRTYTSLLPTVMMRYRISSDINARMFYRTYTQNPSISQLQNVVDNSNPLYLSVGNPLLNQSTNHMLMARYSQVNTKKATSFFGLASVRLINDYITNTTYIASQDSIINEDITLRKGGQISSPVNLDGYLNARILFSYGLPVSFLKSNLNLNLGTVYSRTPGLVNAANNISHATTFTGGVVFASNISENIDYTILYELNLNNIRNDVETNLSNKYLSQNIQLRLNWIFWDGFVFRSSFSDQLYDGYTEEFNDNFILWNMSIAKKFLANKQAELELSVFDLLNQNTSINRLTTESYIEDTRTDVLQQYFMLTFTYTIRNFKGFENREEERRERPGRGRW